MNPASTNETSSSWLAWLTPARGALLAWVVLALGILLRVVVWNQARSVYIDEVNLLRNFLERDYAGLLRPLSYEQYSPPLFSALQKAVIQLLGPGERAIRLVPLLAGCGFLVLFRRLALRWLAPLWAVLALAFVAFGTLFVDYGTICKQYSTDSLLAIGLLVLAERQAWQPVLTGRAALGWAALGSIVVWASMPSVFVLAGVGLALAWTYRTTLLGRTGWQLAGVGAAWGLSFLIYFKLLLQSDAQSDYLQNFHREAFLAFPPQSGAEWKLLGMQLKGLVDKAFGRTALALGLAIVGILVGIVHLVRRPTARTWLLLIPLLACLTASALHYYSLIPRLVLFLLPVLLLLLFTGLNDVSRQRWVGLVLLLGVVLALLNQQRLKHLVVPFQAEFADVRTGLAYVAERQQPGEVLYSYPNLNPVTYYYQQLRPLPLREIVSATVRPSSEQDALQQDVLALAAAGRHRIWIVYDRPDPWVRDWAAQHGKVTQSFDFHRGYAFLLEI